jgi:hypothetical protein
VNGSVGRLEVLPHTLLAHTPTPVESLPNLTARVDGASLVVKRGDCTRLSFGGNDARQVEFYIGEVLSQVTGMPIVGCLRRAGELDRSCSVRFVHTGGTAALFAYAPLLLDEPM